VTALRRSTLPVSATSALASASQMRHAAPLQPLRQAPALLAPCRPVTDSSVLATASAIVVLAFALLVATSPVLPATSPRVPVSSPHARSAYSTEMAGATLSASFLAPLPRTAPCLVPARPAKKSFLSSAKTTAPVQTREVFQMASASFLTALLNACARRASTGVLAAPRAVYPRQQLLVSLAVQSPVLCLPPALSLPSWRMAPRRVSIGSP